MMGRSSSLTLSVLGPFTATLGDDPLPKLPTARATALLIYLAVEQALGAPDLRRELLMELLWPGMPSASARKNLRTTLYYLRQAFDDQVGGGPFLLSDRDAVRIHPDYPLRLDLAQFLSLLDGPPNAWKQATDLYRDDFLCDFSLPDANPFEEWASARRVAFRRQQLQALESLARQALNQGDFAAADNLARHQLGMDALREGAWRQLLASLAHRGRRAEALAEYEACVAALWHELGVEPAPDTQDLYQAILDGTLPPVAPLPPTQPEPPAEEKRPPHLPPQLTSFIGRQRELDEVAGLLQNYRLVSLTGPGGTGKTRLGLQVAQTLASEFADGATFVSLATTTDPVLVPNAIAHELGVVERPDRPLVDSLCRYFAHKHALLVLDNFEHLLPAAPLVADLLAAAPRLAILTTSRELLHLRGEREYPVPPLGVPGLAAGRSLAELSLYESVSLFVERAQAVSPAFDLTQENAPPVAAICRRLDGLPLALELAAARVKLFNPQQLLDRLESSLGILKGGPRDAPARQRTLQDTIDWSYNLLDQEEQRLFARLAVFTGGRTAAAVEIVCGPGLAIDPLDGLESLLNKSLLYRQEGPGGEPRFFTLETINEFARQKLAGSGEEEQLRDRHLAWFIALAEEMGAGHRRRGQELMMDRTEADFDNLRAAFNWALANRQLETAARLVASLDYYLHYRAHLVEGYQWLNRLLATDEIETIPVQQRLRLLVAACRLSYVADDSHRNKQLSQESLRLAREVKDTEAEASALMWLALSFVGQTEEYEQAIHSCQEAIAVFRQLGDEPNLAQALTILGELHRSVNEHEQARKAYEESQAICEEIGDEIRQFVVLSDLSYIAYWEGEYTEAIKLIRVCLSYFHRVGSAQSMILGFALLAGPLAKCGQPGLAAQLLGASAALLNAYGMEHEAGDQPEVAAYSEAIRAQLGQEAFVAAWAAGQALTLEQAMALALDT